MKASVIGLIGLMLVGCVGAPDGEGAALEELRASRELQRVELSTGVELEYLVQGAPPGDPVIFIHGFTDSHLSFSRDLPILPRRYRVYALDLRGHGNSDKPDCCYTQRAFADDVVAFMDALGIESASLVGHSMGSFVAHQVAVDYPDRVDKLVLIGSAPDAANPAVIGFAGVVDTLVDPIDPAFVYAFQASTFYHPIPASFLDIAVSESLKVPASIWKQALNGLIAEDHSAALSTITAPTLIIWGDQDGLFSLAEQQALDTLIPNSTLLVYEQTGHAPHVERPHRFVFDLKHFLD